MYAVSGQKVAYEDLSIEQFFAGYLAATRISKASIQSCMYAHLEILAEDMASFDFASVRSCHGIWLQEDEQRRVTWMDHATRDTLRRRFIWNPAISRAKTSRPPQPHQAARCFAPTLPVPSKANICAAFNKGDCSIAGDHQGADHVCSYCARALHRRCLHSELECLKEFVASKKTGKKGF